MCGIAGFSRYQFEPGDESLLTTMGQAILHRGPDAGGTYLDDHVGLCHRRLSILDLSAAGNQPMFSKDGRYVIVFNGEIYNFLESRAALEAEGHVFSTHTDTEVILALYAKHGKDCLAELNGMFAFAIWDKQEKSLFLARDRMGKKPLYYTYEEGKLAFASEIKALLPVPFACFCVITIVSYMSVLQCCFSCPINGNKSVLIYLKYIYCQDVGSLMRLL